MKKLAVGILRKKPGLFDFILAIVYTGGLESQRRRNYGTGSKHMRVVWALIVNIVCLRLSLAKQKKNSVKFKLTMRSERLFKCLLLRLCMNIYWAVIAGGVGWLVWYVG